jgi:hypothetical protein
MPAYKQLYLDAKKENEKLKDYKFIYDKDVWSPVELLRILDNYELDWNGVCKEVEKLKEELKTEKKHNEHLSNQLNKSESRNDEYVEQLEGIMNEKGTEHILGCNAYEKFCQAICELNYDEEWITELKAENKQLIAKNKELNKELEYEADTSFAELTEEIKELKENLKLSEDKVCELTHENMEYCGIQEENKELKEKIDDLENTNLHLESEKDDLEKETISRKEHQKVADFLNAEAEKYKVKFMEATGQLEK